MSGTSQMDRTMMVKNEVMVIQDRIDVLLSSFRLESSELDPHIIEALHARSKLTVMTQPP